MFRIPATATRANRTLRGADSGPINQGYEFISVKSPTAMLANVRDQLQRLNGVVFNESEWRRFAEQYLDSPSDSSSTKPVKSISTISVILRLMMVVWKTSI